MELKIPMPNANIKEGKPKKETSDQSVKAKWGERLFHVYKTRKMGGMGGYIPVIRSFLRLYHRMKLSPQAAMAALHIIDSKWDKQAPWTSASLLAKRLGKSESQAKKYIAELRKVGVKATYTATKREYTFDFEDFFEKLADMAEAEIEEFKKKKEEASHGYY